MMRRWSVIVALLVGLVGSVAMPVTVAAASPATQVAVCSSGAGNFFGFQPWYACLPKDDKGNPKITSQNDIFKILFPVVESIIKLAMYVAIGMIFFMLFKIATANGNSNTFATALGGMRDAVIGLIIAMVSVAIVNFIAGAFK